MSESTHTNEPKVTGVQTTTEQKAEPDVRPDIAMTPELGQKASTRPVEPGDGKVSVEMTLDQLNDFKLWKEARQVELKALEIKKRISDRSRLSDLKTAGEEGERSLQQAFRDTPDLFTDVSTYQVGSSRGISYGEYIIGLLNGVDFSRVSFRDDQAR